MHSSITQKNVMDSFISCVDDLTNKIRAITDENPDPVMAANKTKRIITKWFNHAGRL